MKNKILIITILAFVAVSLIFVFIFLENKNKSNELNTVDDTIISCNKDSDCFVVTSQDQANSCCWGCGYETLNQKGFEQRKKENKKCLKHKVICKVKCKALLPKDVHAKCVEGKCVTETRDSDKSCKVDNDCRSTCGCGCINQNENCVPDWDWQCDNHSQCVCKNNMCTELK